MAENSRASHSLPHAPLSTRRVFLAWKDDSDEELVVKFFKKRFRQEAYFDESMASFQKVPAPDWLPRGRKWA